MKIHTPESIAKEFNSEVVVPLLWHPPRFERADWMWIKNVAQASQALDGRIADIRIGSGPNARRLTCMHRTQPHRNFTVFYRRLAETTILVLGIGSHNVSDKQYTVQWADGSKSRIVLSKTLTSGEHYLVNPIGGTFGFRTLDPLLNAKYLHATAATA